MKTNVLQMSAFHTAMRVSAAAILAISMSAGMTQGALASDAKKKIIVKESGIGAMPVDLSLSRKVQPASPKRYPNVTVASLGRAPWVCAPSGFGKMGTCSARSR